MFQSFFKMSLRQVACLPLLIAWPIVVFYGRTGARAGEALWIHDVEWFLPSVVVFAIVILVTGCWHWRIWLCTFIGLLVLPTIGFHSIEFRIVARIVLVGFSCGLVIQFAHEYDEWRNRSMTPPDEKASKDGPREAEPNP